MSAAGAGRARRSRISSTTRPTCSTVWELMAWVGLFTADGQYLVPSTDAPAGDPSTTLSLIYDDRLRLEERAKRLMSKAAHAEFPHSQTRHLVSNVRIVRRAGRQLAVACNFVVYRSKGETNDVYPGHARTSSSRSTARCASASSGR